MKLDGGIFRYLTKEDIRVLVAVEMGMRNHELVPSPLIESIAKLKRGGTFKVLAQLLKYKLLHHEAKQYDGYYLTYAGYDVLAIHTLVQRGNIVGLGNMIGTGKESDIYMCRNQAGEDVVLKLARLGRMSFRAVKSKRDYLKYRSKNNWLYLSRLAAVKEYSYMELLHEHGFPTPRPIDQNRHAILMSLVPGFPLQQVTHVAHPEKTFSKLMNILVRFAEHGLIHGDFNEFNILVNEAEEIYVIDFPQMVSIDHLNAESFFDRDVETLRSFFRRRTDTVFDEFPRLADIVPTERLDRVVKASGYAAKHLQREELEDIEDMDPSGPQGAGETGEEEVEVEGGAEGEAGAECEATSEQPADSREPAPPSEDYEETKDAGTNEEQGEPEDEASDDSSSEEEEPESSSAEPRPDSPRHIAARVKKQLSKAARRPHRVKAHSSKQTDY